MKTLAAIWIAVLISAVGTVGYVNASINSLVVGKTFTIDHVSEPVNPQSTISVKVLQPAANVQADQTGGNGQDYELQPALGYNALNWNSKIEVQ